MHNPTHPDLRQMRNPGGGRRSNVLCLECAIPDQWARERYVTASFLVLRYYFKAANGKEPLTMAALTQWAEGQKTA